jgi:hypothetical protein
MPQLDWAGLPATRFTLLLQLVLGFLIIFGSDCAQRVPLRVVPGR